MKVQLWYKGEESNFQHVKVSEMGDVHLNTLRSLYNVKTVLECHKMEDWGNPCGHLQPVDVNGNPVEGSKFTWGQDEYYWEEL